jgi:glucan phosphoethanolaminetransferase (alkaline phosphatase superfamily)
VQSNVQPVYYLTILALLVAGVAAYAIFQFKNRVLQSALCAVNSILLTVLMGLVIYFTFYKTAKLFDVNFPANMTLVFTDWLALCSPMFLQTVLSARTSARFSNPKDSDNYFEGQVTLSLSFLLSFDSLNVTS